MTIRVGVLGAGPSTRKNTAALLKDWVAGQGDDHVIFIVPASQMTDAARHVADWAIVEGHTVVIAVTATEFDESDIEDYYDDALVTDTTDAPVTSGPIYEHLFIAWDTEQEERCEAWAEAAGLQGIKVYDLTDGLYPITITPEGSQAVTEPADLVVDTDDVKGQGILSVMAPGPQDEAQSTMTEGLAQAGVTTMTLAIPQEDPFGPLVERLAQKVTEDLPERLADRVVERVLEILRERLA